MIVCALVARFSGVSRVPKAQTVLTVPDFARNVWSLPTKITGELRTQKTGPIGSPMIFTGIPHAAARRAPRSDPRSGGVRRPNVAA
jgi:hypothetical protein